MTTQCVGSLAIGHTAPLTSQLVGRQGELALIWNQYRVARDGSARVVLLVGELGIGKTRLLDEVARQLIKDSAIVLRGVASDSEGMPPYLPFLEALGQYIRATPPDVLHEQIALAPQILLSVLPELAARLDELPGNYPLPPEQARLRLYEAIGTFLEVISASHPLVLLLDDLHWADSASFDLLCYILRHHSAAKLLILGTCRAGESDQNLALEQAVNELIRQRVLARVALNPLSEEEIKVLAVNYLGGPISPNIGVLLFAQSEGNPFFAEEILQCWVEMGALAQNNRRWVAVAPLEHTLPLSIVGALRQRFARLSTEVIDQLRIAAIIGRTFDVALLAAVEGQEVEFIEEIILEAVHARLVRAGQTDLFTFSHDKIRETLYAEVSASRSRRLHGTVGRILEARYDQEDVNSVFLLAELAFHFSQSGDRERGANYSLLAAEQASRSLAVDEAITHYRTALELLDPDDGRYGHLLLSLGQAMLLTGKDKEAETINATALEWFLQRKEHECAAHAAHGLGIAQWRQENLQEARETLKYALVLLGHHMSEAMVRVLVDLSTLLTLCMDQQDEGSSYAEQALAMAQRLGDKSLQAAASRAVAGRLYVTADEISNASGSMERALALAEASDTPGEAAECCLYLAGAYCWMTEIRHSWKANLRGMEFIDSCFYPYQLRYAYSWSSFIFSSQGEWEEAALAIEQAQSIVDRLSSPVASAFLSQVRGFLAYQREDYASAESELQAAPGCQPRGPGGLIYTGLLGLAQVALGKCEEASASMAELDALLAELPAGTVPTAPILLCLALMAMAVGDQERVENLFPSLLAFRGQHHWFLVDRVLGEMAAHCGKWEVAVIHLSAAQATAKRERLRPELARTLVAQATFHLKCGGKQGSPQATSLLKQALVLFEELGLLSAVQEVQQQLRSLSSRSESSTFLSLPAGLTRREAKVLQLVARGKSNRLIAKELDLSEKTVANHLSHIFMKTASENRAAAAVFAIRHELV